MKPEVLSFQTTFPFMIAVAIEFSKFFIGLRSMCFENLKIAKLYSLFNYYIWISIEKVITQFSITTSKQCFSLT